MRLNQRVWWAIVPVLIISYMLIFSGIYYTEKKSYIKQEQARLQLQLSQLESLYNRYNSFVDIYYSFLVGSMELRDLLSLKSDKLKAFAIERNLSSVLNDLTDIKFDVFSLAIINTRGEIKYFYEGGLDPFSEPNHKMPSIVASMFSQKKSQHKQILLGDSRTTLVQARIINPVTMRKPLADAWQDNAVAIILMFDLTSFDRLRVELEEKQGYRVHLGSSPHFDAQYNTEYSVYGTEQFSDLMWLYMNYDDARIAQSLWTLLLRMLLITIILVACSSVLLIILIARYITKPMQILEKNILAVNESEAKFPIPGGGKDEISSLQRAFSKLYQQLKSSYEQSKHQAQTDSLTKLHNRRMFNDRFDGLIDRAGSGSRIALIYIDLDNFKFVNDNYGHKAGDDVLQEFATKLAHVVRLTDIVMGENHYPARMAGDEFAVIVNDFSNELTLNKIAERILNIFDGGFNCSAGHFPVSASIGIAVYPRDGESAADLIVNADAAMYQAKHAGKNQYAYYSQELAQKARREQQIETELRKKDFSEFVLYYMPLIDAKTNRLIGVEALIRWNSCELGTVSPAEFIPIAESRGLFEDLDFWVFNRALEDLAVLQRIIGQNGKLSINISSAQLNSDVFFYRLMQTMNNKGLTTANLELEITETFDAVMSKRVETNLSLLKQAGFTLALDDFGAGHTSLNQLIEYPVDVIKIDKSLIDHMQGSGLDLVVALVAFCKRLGFFVTAEGVETIEQADALREAGVDALQGFYFDEPLSLEDLMERYGSVEIKEA